MGWAVVMRAHLGLSFCVLSIINTINSNENSALCKTLLEGPVFGYYWEVFCQKSNICCPPSINSFFLGLLLVFELVVRKTRALSQELKLEFLSKQNPEFRASLLLISLISAFFSVFWGDFSYSLCLAGRIPTSRDMRAPPPGFQVLAPPHPSL